MHCTSGRPFSRLTNASMRFFCCLTDFLTEFFSIVVEWGGWARGAPGETRVIDDVHGQYSEKNEDRCVIGECEINRRDTLHPKKEKKEEK